MERKKINILYIGGSGRRGSTILGNVLGQVEGVVHVGELWSLRGVGLARKKNCGCGKALAECEKCRAILEKTFGIL